MSEAERINTPISTTELERRWGLVRAAMAERRIDALLMQNNNDFMGGYVKYFTDLPATNGYPVTVVFPRDEGMTVIGQGPFGMDRTLPPEGDGLRRGVQRVLTTPSYASAPFTRRLRRGARGEGAGAVLGRDHRSRRHRDAALCHRSSI